MSRIDAVYSRLKSEGKKALIPFVTAGDPGPELTVPLMHELVAAGADIIELGVPFSDPMSDGPVIQRASERALANGMTLARILELVGQFRQRDLSTPVVLMGYANPFEAMGYERFAKAAKAVGVDGVLTVDCPPEEGAVWLDALRSEGIDPIFLLSPTTLESRVAMVSKLASGYIYYVSLKGVTGSANLDMLEVEKKIARIRAHTDLPVCIGFGIRDALTARSAANIADGVVIGSRIVQEIESSSRDAVLANVAGFVKAIRDAIDSEQGEP